MSSSFPVLLGGEACDFPRSDVRLIVAVAISGSIAAVLADPAFWISTAGVVFLLVRASRKGQASDVDSVAERQHLPTKLRRVLHATMAELPEGEAKELLIDLTSQAANVYAPREATFDAEWDRTTRRNVAALAEAACGVASDVARLDLAIAQTHPERRLADGLFATRQLFLGRLRDAVSAVTALYAAGVENGTPESDRVGELVSEIRADAALTSHARTELDKLLRAG